MNELTKERLGQLTERIRQRKARLLEEIREGLVRSGSERYADLLGEAGDAGDESVGNLLRDVTEAEIVRDVGEVRDIVAAERLADWALWRVHRLRRADRLQAPRSLPDCQALHHVPAASPENTRAFQVHGALSTRIGGAGPVSAVGNNAGGRIRCREST